MEDDVKIYEELSDKFKSVFTVEGIIASVLMRFTRETFRKEIH